MSDYRIDLRIEHDDQYSYVVHETTGRRYLVTAFDLKRREQDYVYQDVLHSWFPEKWELYLGLQERRGPWGPPDPPKRSWSRVMGLRRPK